MRSFFLLIGTFTLITLHAQKTISGKVSDNKGKPIPFANIYLKNSYDGTTSNLEGDFSLRIQYLENQDPILVISCIGYETKERAISKDDLQTNLQIKLKVDFNQIEGVVVTAGSFEASDEKKSVTLKPIDIVTTAGGAADIYETMKLLPGTQQVGETEGLFVRGGSASETVTIIDEMVVQNPFYSSVPDVPQRSRFQPFLFKGTMFSTGGYSSIYGQALSSALILNSQDLADSTTSGVGLHLAGSNVFHAQRWKNTSASVGIEYTNLAPYFELVKQNTDWIKPPENLNGEFIFRHKPSSKSLLKLYVLQGLSKLEMNYDEPTNSGIISRRYKQENNNLFLISSYNGFLSENLKLFIGASYSNNTDKNRIDDIPLKINQELYQGKAFLTRYFGADNTLKLGGEYQVQNNNLNFSEYYSGINNSYYAGFVEWNQHLTARLASRIGLRSEYTNYNGSFSVSPRIAIAYKTGINSQVSFAYGTYHQPTEDSILHRNMQLENEQAAHYIANYQWNNKDRVLRIEAYYKDYDNLARNLENNQLEYNNSGYGYARGIDFFWRDESTISNTDYWISYSYIDSKRLYRNLPGHLKPTFISDHNLSIVFKYTFQDILTTVGASYSTASSRSFYRPIDINTYRNEFTPSYHNLSISASKLASLWGQFAVFYAAVYNIFNHENEFAYAYSPNGAFKTMSGSTSLRSFFVGCFIAIN